MKEHVYIPLPQEVIERQERLRTAREVTASLFGVANRPFEMHSSEYIYFREWFKD